MAKQNRTVNSEPSTAVPTDVDTSFNPDELTETAIVPAPASTLATAVDYSGYGSEHAAEATKLKAEDVIIPMLKIVQESSKIYKAYKGKECPFKIGDIYDATTKRVYSAEEGVLVALIAWDEYVIERKPSPDGSFLAKWKVKDPYVQTAFVENNSSWAKLQTKQRTQLGYTEEALVAVLDPTNPDSAVGVAVVPFQGTSVFPAKQWRNAMSRVPYASVTPKYAFRCVLRTELRPGVNGGLDSYKFRVDPMGFDPKAGTAQNLDTLWSNCRANPASEASKAFLARALELKQLFAKGALGKVDHSQVDGDAETAAENAEFGGETAAF